MSKEIDDLRRVVATLIVWVSESQNSPLSVAEASRLLGMLHGGVEDRDVEKKVASK